MKVKVNIDNTTVPSLIMITLIVFEESLAMETHTDRHTDIYRQTRFSSMLTFFNKNTPDKNGHNFLSG